MNELEMFFATLACIALLAVGLGIGLTEMRNTKPPVDMVLHCPHCHHQHIDAPEISSKMVKSLNGMPITKDDERRHAARWKNPPHRSHLCHNCGFQWRPADVHTNGVEAIKTRGQNDTEVLG